MEDEGESWVFISTLSTSCPLGELGQASGLLGACFSFRFWHRLPKRKDVFPSLYLPQSLVEGARDS